MKRKSVQKPAGSFRVLEKHSTLKRSWFPRGKGVPQKFDGECERKGLIALRGFEPWNSNESQIALALGKADEILLFDGAGRPWKLSADEAMTFLAEMCHESQGGDHFWGERYFYESSPLP